MEVLNAIKPTARLITNRRTRIENNSFEYLWQNSISGEEFVQQAHEHIKDLYAIRDKQ
jgi:hypothetical protein